MDKFKMELMGPDDFKGFLSLRRANKAVTAAKNADGTFRTIEAAEAADFARKLGEGKEFAELISAADIGATTDVLDREIIAGFQDFMADGDTDLKQIFSPRPTDDFIFRAILFSALENYSPKKDHEGYDAAYIDVDDQDNELAMWGKLVHVSWKAWRSNRGEVLRTLPTQLGIAGKRTLQRIFAALLGTQNAAWQQVYSLANGNLFTLPLTLTNLETVLTAMKLLADPMTNEPRATKMFYLVVPETLRPTADRVVKPILDTLALQSIGGNWRPTGIEKIISNPMLDRYGTDWWWLFAKPIGTQGVAKDAFLKGNEAPEMFIKTSDAQRISGSGPEELGSFRTDNLSWKARLARKAYWLPDLFWMTAISTPSS